MNTGICNADHLEKPLVNDKNSQVNKRLIVYSLYKICSEHIDSYFNSLRKPTTLMWPGAHFNNMDYL